ncbi:hypothetical protein, partial [Tessaracoccus sp.]
MSIANVNDMMSTFGRSIATAALGMFLLSSCAGTPEQVSAVASTPVTAPTMFTAFTAVVPKPVVKKTT